MATPKIDRSAWASLVGELIEQESGGNQTHFAQAVGVDRKTVARWLAGASPTARNAVDVSEEKVRAVARALGVSPRDLLVRVGYYRADEMPIEDTSDRIQDANAAIELVRDSDLSLSAKRELIAHFVAQRQEYERQQVAEAQRLIDLARGRGRRAS